MTPESGLLLKLQKAGRIFNRKQDSRNKVRGKKELGIGDKGSGIR
jgi:hypothetical protein